MKKIITFNTYTLTFLVVLMILFSVALVLGAELSGLPEAAIGFVVGAASNLVAVTVGIMMAERFGGN